jgi:hypothetical protein
MVAADGGGIARAMGGWGDDSSRGAEIRGFPQRRGVHLLRSLVFPGGGEVRPDVVFQRRWYCGCWVGRCSLMMIQCPLLGLVRIEGQVPTATCI